MKIKIDSINDMFPIKTSLGDYRETTIAFYEDESTCSLITTSNKMLTKMKACFKQNPEEYVCYANTNNGIVVSYEFIFPVKYLTFRKKKKPGRTFTEEEKKELAERMKKARSKKNDN